MTVVNTNITHVEFTGVGHADPFESPHDRVRNVDGLFEGVPAREDDAACQACPR
jgi:hypothetical protein